MFPKCPRINEATGYDCIGTLIPVIWTGYHFFTGQAGVSRPMLAWKCTHCGHQINHNDFGKK